MGEMKTSQHAILLADLNCILKVICQGPWD